MLNDKLCERVRVNPSWAPFERFKGKLFENHRKYAKSDNTIQKGLAETISNDILQVQFELTAAAQIAYPNKFTTFPTKLIKYLHNFIEIYMYIGYRLGQRQRQTPVGVLELRSCGTSQRIQYYFKVNLVNFWLFWYFLCIFPIKLMFASTLTPNTAAQLPLIRKL